MRLPSRPIPLVLAAGALAASIGFIVSPTVRDGSTVSIRAGWLAYSFILAWLLGGIGTVYGWDRRKTEYEAFGLMLTGFGCLAYSFAIIATRGHHGYLAVCIIASAGLGHILRSWELVRS